MVYQSLGVARAAAFLLTLCCFTLGALPASGQSDPSNFTTVINSPDAIIGDNEPIGSDTQLNIFDGADIGRNLGNVGFDSTNVEINVFGGVVPNIGSIYDGVTVNVSGGLVGTAEGINGRSGLGISAAVLTPFDAGASISISGGTIQGSSQLFGGVVTITGGEFLGPITAFSPSLSISGGTFSDIVNVTDILNDSGSLTLTAGDLRLNGEAFTGNTLPSVGDGFASLTTRDVLSGTFADGSGFIFSGEDGDQLMNGTSIQAISLPAPDLQPIAISQTTDTAPQNLRTGQTLTLSNNGSLGVGFTAVGSTVSIEGGNVGDSFEASEATVSVTGGNIGERFNAFGGSDVNITGGSFGRDFLAGDDSNVRISGGSFGDSFESTNASTTFVGGEFLLNGVALSDSSSVSVTSSDDVFTATLADGTVSIFASTPISSDRLQNVNLETSTLPAADLSPIVLDGNSSSQPKGLRSGQSLTVLNGGSVDRNFAAVNATVDVQGGSVGDSFEVASAEVTVSGGTIGERFNVFQDSRVTISGGVIGQGFGAAEGTTVDLRGGSIGDSAFVEGTLSLSGGTIGSDATFSGNNQVNISGGSVGDGLTLQNNVHLVVSGDGVLGNDVFLREGGTLDINGGSVGNGLAVRNLFSLGDPVVNLFDGSIGDDAEFSSDGILNIHGGSVGERLVVLEGGTVNIFGGSVSESFEARSGGTVNLFVTEGLLDGVALNLFEDVPFELTDFSAPLDGILSDGSVFRFDSSNLFSGSTINLFRASAVPEPSTCLLGVALLLASACRRRRTFRG